MEKLLELDDIGLVPAQTNSGNHESNCDYFVYDNFDGNFRSLPIFTSPMDSVINEENWRVYYDNLIRPVLPRTTDIKIRLEGCEYIFAAFSIPEVRENFLSFKRNSPRQFRICIDSGNGHDMEVFNITKDLKKMYGDQTLVMIGNIGNPKAYDNASTAQADYVRVGMTSGSLVSDTRGFSYPMATMLLDIKAMKASALIGKKHPKIIADGGISSREDILKALALGADYVMIGRQFAKMAEAAGVMFKTVKGGDGLSTEEEVPRGTVASMTRLELEKAKIKRYYAGNTTYQIQARRDGYSDVHDWAGKRRPCDSKVDIVQVSYHIGDWLNDLYEIFTYGFTMADALKWSEFKTKINICRIQ